MWSLRLLRALLINAVIKRYLLLPVIMFVPIESADWPEQTFYSIQIAAFKNLQVAKAQVNLLKSKGEIVFWKKVAIPEKGEYYRVYIGKYEDRAIALKVWKKLILNQSVNYCEIHKFKESFDHRGIDISRTAIVSGDADIFKAFHPIQSEKRFVDNQDGTVTDTNTNLMWIKDGRRFDFFTAETWWEANKRCEGFRLGGYSNWRLPTITEWIGLIDTTKQSPALVEPNPFKNIVFHMSYWSGTDFLFGIDYSLRRNIRSFHAYTVMLYSGKIQHQNKSERSFVWPVRSID